MSGAERHEHSAGAAAGDVEARAAAWLIKRHDSGEWSEDDQRALNAWLDEAWAHRVAYWRLDTAWERADRLGVLRPRAAARVRISPVLLRIAAGFAIVAVLGAAAGMWLSHPTEKTYSTAVGDRELVSFTDGTQIELNTNTLLRATMTTRERIVWLDKGEAYFQVRHNPAQPFIVMIGDRRITDLGTKFLVRRDAGDVKVSLVEGSVRLGAGKNLSQTAMLWPGEEAILAAGSISVTKKTPKDISNELGWRRGVLVFRHTTLASAAAEFNRYNSQKVVIASPKAASLTIDGTFLTNDPGAFTDAAQTVFGLHVQNRGDEIVISR